MTDKYKGWYPDYIENEKEREPVLKLAKMMTGRAKKKLGLEKMTKYDPEYWGLALLCTDEQAEIALKMGVRQPKTLDQMVKVTGKDRDYLEKQLRRWHRLRLWSITGKTHSMRSSMYCRSLYLEVQSSPV